MTEELRVKITAEMASVQNAVSSISKSLSSLSGSANNAEKALNNIGKSTSKTLKDLATPMLLLNKSIDSAVKNFRNFGNIKGLKNNVADIAKMKQGYAEVQSKLIAATKALEVYKNIAKEAANQPISHKGEGKGLADIMDAANQKVLEYRQQIIGLEAEMRSYEAVLNGLWNKQGKVFMPEQIFKLKKEYKALETQILPLKQTIEEATTIKQGALQSIEEYKNNIKEAEEAIKNNKEPMKASLWYDLQNVIKGYRTEIDKANATVKEQDKILSDSQESYDGLLGKLAAVKGSLTAAEGASDGFMGALAAGSAGAIAAVGAIAAAIAVVVYNVAEAVNVVKTVPKYAKQAANAIWTITTKVGGLMKQLNPFPKAIAKIGSAFDTLISRVKSTILRQSVSKAVTYLRETLTKYLGVNTQVTDALTRLKVSWLTAFQPIYEAVIPILVTLINYLTMAGRALASFLSMLTGKSVSSFAASAKALYESANGMNEIEEGAGGASDAAKELQKTLTGFDELEILSKRNESGGGGGGAIDEAALTDWEPTEFNLPQWNSWGEAFSSLLDKILEKLPGFHDWLIKAADAINKFFTNLKEAFTFQGVLEKVSKIATELAQAFNDFVNRIDWKTMGEAIGAGLNLAIQFLKDFIYTFDWENLGKSFAEGINGLFSQINWENVGALLVSGWNIVWQTLYGFVHEFDWVAFGNDIADTIDGAFKNIDFASCAKTLTEGILGALTSIDTALDNIDFDQIVAKVQEFFDNLDPEGIAQKFSDVVVKAFESLGPTVSTVLTNVFETVNKVVKNIKWEEIGESIGKFINDIDWDSLLNSIGSLVSQKLPNLLKLISGAIKTIDWGEIGDAIYNMVGNMVTDIDWNDMLGNLFDIIIGLFRIKFNILTKALFGLMSGIIAEVFGFIAGGWFALLEEAVSSVFNTLAGLFEDFGIDCVAGFLRGVADTAKGIAEWFKTNLIDPVVNGVKNFLGIHSPSTVFASIGTDIVNGLLKGLKDTWSNITSFFTTNFETVKTTVVNCWNNIKSNTIEKWDAIKTKVTTTVENVKKDVTDKWTNMKNTVQQRNNELKSDLEIKWTTLKNNLTTTTETLRTTVRTKWDTLKIEVGNIMTNWKTDIETKYNTLKNNVTTYTNTLKTSVTTAYENMRSEASSKISSMRTSIENTIISLKTNVNTYTSNIQSTITTKMNTAKSNAVSAFNNMSSSIENVLEGLKSTVGSIFTWISNKVKAIWQKVNSAREAEDSGFDDDGGYVNSGPGAYKMASGGVVTKPTLTWVGEYAGAASNPEIVTPQNLLTSIIDNSQNGLIDVWLQTTRQIIQTIENKDMDVRIDDSAIAGAVVRSNIASMRRTGQALI